MFSINNTLLGGGERWTPGTLWGKHHMTAWISLVALFVDMRVHLKKSRSIFRDLTPLRHWNHGPGNYPKISLIQLGEIL